MNLTRTILPSATAKAGAKTAAVRHRGRRFIRLLLAGPGSVRPWAARWAVTLLAVAGAALLVWSGIIHLMLWNDGYQDISVIGPLFLVQGIGGIVIAAAIVVFRRLLVLAAGAVTLGATAVGLLLSVHVGLFGYRESLAIPYAELSLTVEFTGAAILAIAAAIIAAMAFRDRANP
jgi:hypothetical protein